MKRKRYREQIERDHAIHDVHRLFLRLRSKSLTGFWCKVDSNNMDLIGVMVSHTYDTLTAADHTQCVATPSNDVRDTNERQWRLRRSGIAEVVTVVCITRFAGCSSRYHNRKARPVMVAGIIGTGIPRLRSDSVHCLAIAIKYGRHSNV